jgi:ABC-2 type transport system permease protein
MDIQTVLAIIRKEVYHVIRDRRTLGLVIFMPFMQLLMYGYGINTDVKHLSTVVFNEDQSPLSRRLVDAFVQSAYFDIVAEVQSLAEARRLIDRGQAKVGLHIGSGFAKRLLAGRQAPLQMLIDGSDSNPANTAMNTGQAIVAAFIQKERLAPVAVSPIDYRPRMWYNPDLKSSFFMVPGVVGLLLQLLVPMISASAIVREKERGNIEQLLVTPIKPIELMIGKMVPYMGIGLIIATTVLVSARFLFDIPIRGSVFTLYVLTLLFIAVCLGLGLFVSTVAENQQQASQMIMMFAAPSILLSGFIFPREGMPWLIQALGSIIPLTYVLEILRGITLKGLGFVDLLPQIIPLAVMAVLILYLSVKKFHKRLG